MFNIGGGLGIRYTARDQPSSIAEFAAVAVRRRARGAERHGMATPTLLVEPGRSIAGKAAVTAYTRRHRQGDPRRCAPTWPSTAA